MAVVPLDSRQASITRLLLTEERPSTVEAIASELNLTGRIVRYNLPSIDTYLRGEGIAVRGSELDIRKGLLSLVLEAVPAEELLAEMVKPNGSPTQSAEGRGLSEFAARLDLPTHREILTEQLLPSDDGGSMAMVATLYLAIVSRRVRAGHPAEMRGGQLRSLIDHPVAAAAARIAAAVEAQA